MATLNPKSNLGGLARYFARCREEGLPPGRALRIALGEAEKLLGRRDVHAVLHEFLGEVQLLDLACGQMRRQENDHKHDEVAAEAAARLRRALARLEAGG